MMPQLQLRLLVLDLLEAALAAGSVDEAAEALSFHVDALAHVDLVRVAAMLAAESMVGLTPAEDRARLAERIEQARVDATWAVDS